MRAIAPLITALGSASVLNTEAAGKPYGLRHNNREDIYIPLMRAGGSEDVFEATGDYPRTVLRQSKGRGAPIKCLRRDKTAQKLTGTCRMVTI